VGRDNSHGIYLHTETERGEFFGELEIHRTHLYNEGADSAQNSIVVRNPYDQSIVGHWQAAASSQLNAMVANACVQQKHWQRLTVETRAACVEKYAELSVSLLVAWRVFGRRLGIVWSHFLVSH